MHTLFFTVKGQRLHNHQNTSFCCIVLTFECYIQHSNVATFKGLFECRAIIRLCTTVDTIVSPFAARYTN